MRYMLALYAREVRRFRKIWMDTLFTPIISTLLFLTVFGVLMGQRSIGNAQALPFIYTGLLGMTIINASFMNPGFALVLAKNHGTIVDLQLVPIPRWQIGLAYTLAAATRALVALTTVIVTSIWFVPDMTLTHPALLVVAILLTGIEFGLIGTVFGMWASSFEAVTFMTTFIMQPMIFLGGVFYPIQSLPGIWQTISQFNPLFHNINLIRYGFIGYSDVPPLFSLGVMIAATLLLFFILNQVIHRKLSG